MNKDKGTINCLLKLNLSKILAKCEAKAGLARYYYKYDDSYCKL